jgi:hypothetical protein
MSAAITIYHALPDWAQASVAGAICGGLMAIWIKFLLWLIPDQRLSGKGE